MAQVTGWALYFLGLVVGLLIDKVSFWPGMIMGFIAGIIVANVAGPLF